ncbi:hypothetical protein M2T87_07490 [Elizabethkingia ursingii]|nr:hypothetical protein [Elizabethkingia ursingii]MCL1671538.1 hypothetical protein [Elizabethkingia ursingii]
MVSPSTVMTAILSPSDNISKPLAQASLGMNPVAAVSGTPLISGMKFRVIAYRSNGNYHTHQDYTVGQAATPMMVDNGASYNFIVYSFGTASLPAISVGEQNNISSATVNYDDANRDFMYQKIAFTPTNNSNTLNITLRHKISRITTILNSTNLENITAVSGGVLTPHYSNGVYSLNSGTMSGRTTLSTGMGLNFPSLGSSSVTATPAFLNSDTGGIASGNFSANVTIGGVTKAISLPNSFKITPENDSKLTINLTKCGGYLGAGGTLWKDFMCQNLGGTAGLDPLSLQAGNHGAKYQWGSNGAPGWYISQTNDQSNSGAISGWNNTTALTTVWDDTNKTTFDPCPSGFKVPSRAQLLALINNNTLELVGTWIADGNYTTAIYIRSPLNNARTLMFPAAGYRRADTGALEHRGDYGLYWTSTSIALGSSYDFTFSTASQVLSTADNHLGGSIKCIAQ